MPHEPDHVDVSLPGAVAEMLPPGALHAPGPAVEIRTLAVAATIVLGCVALLILGIQPVVLGALQSAGRLSVPAMGQAAMLETLALGAVSAGMAARIPHTRLRLWGLAGALGLLLGNVAGLFASDLAFVLSRGFCGVAGGVLVWLATGLITRRIDASRINAIFLGAQALSQGAVAALVPTGLAPSLGSNSGLWAIVAGAVVAVPLVLLIPDRLPDPPHDETRPASSLHLSSLSGLAASLFMMAGIVGLWVYVEPIARAVRVPESVVSFAIAASLGVQVVGAVIMVAVERWVKPVPGLLATAAAFLGVTATFAWVPSQTAFVAATLVIGLLWTFALVLVLPLLLEADPTRKAPMYMPAANLLGSSLGPLVAGALATDANIRPALVVAAVLFVLAAAAVTISALSRPKA